MPQEIISQLSNNKEAQLIFNIRRWDDRIADERMKVDVEHKGIKTQLFVIIPAFLVNCPMSVGTGWNESSFVKEDTLIASDNRQVIDEKKRPYPYRANSDFTQRFFLAVSRQL